MAALAQWIGNTGTDFSQPLTLLDSAGTVFDFTNYTLTCEIRTAIDGLLLETATCTTVLATAGTVNIELTDTQMDTIAKGTWWADVKAVDDGTGDIYRSDPVNLVVQGEVTA